MWAIDWDGKLLDREARKPRSYRKEATWVQSDRSKKILLYWAGKRDLSKDIIYSTYSPSPVTSIEAQMSTGAIFTTYSGYRLRFGEAPVDYDEVYVYADSREVKRMFPKRVTHRKNIFVLSPDPHLKRVSEGGVAPLAQIYVDLWQLGRAADRFVDELDRKLELAGVGALKEMIRRVRMPQKKGPELSRRA